MEKLSDVQLRDKTAEFKERLRKGESLDDLLVEAFAVCLSNYSIARALYCLQTNLPSQKATIHSAGSVSPGESRSPPILFIEYLTLGTLPPALEKPYPYTLWPYIPCGDC